MATEICYPFAISPTGDLEVTSDRVELCRQAILSAVSTILGERVYRDDYGIRDFVFTTNQAGVAVGVVRAALDVGLKEDYPDCEYKVYGVNSDDGRFIAIVTYAIEDVTKTIRILVT